MTIFEAVFNCHINEAESKAINIFKKVYGKQRFGKCIQPRLQFGHSLHLSCQFL